MGLSGAYNDPVPDDFGISIITEAFNCGVTFFNTADVYGPETNEILVGKVTVLQCSSLRIQKGMVCYLLFNTAEALKKSPREKVQLATKFGIMKVDFERGVVARGTREYVRLCCEASLKRLDVDYIDLYYQHRVDTTVPIEETMEELKKLVEDGKIKYMGLSGASPDKIRRAHDVHPITAIQMEWSLWTHDIEDEIVPLCRELGIGIVPFSPLGNGFFSGKAVAEAIPANSTLGLLPRFKGENLEKNKVFYSRVEKLAEKHRCSPAQLALSWVLHQGDNVVPIPGTTKIKNLESNIGSLRVKFTEEDLKEISGAVPVGEIARDRIFENFLRCSWKFANTPLRDNKERA